MHYHYYGRVEVINDGPKALKNLKQKQMKKTNKTKKREVYELIWRSVLEKMQEAH